MLSAESNPAYKKGILCIYQGERVVGTGFHISEGYVVTCAHVVVQALQLDSKYKNISAGAVANSELTVQFPLVESQPFYKSWVIGQLWCVASDDIAVIQIKEELASEILPSPIQPSVNSYQGHHFRALGFSDNLGQGVWTSGRIAGEISNYRIQLEGAEQNVPDIQPGFSGAPVWDEELGIIIGMISQNTVERDEDFENLDINRVTKRSFMIPYKKKLEIALQEINIRILLDMLTPHTKNVMHYLQQAYECYVRPSGSSEDYPGGLGEILRAASQQQEICSIIACLLLPAAGVPEELRKQLERWLQAQPYDILEIKKKVELRFQPRPPQYPGHCQPHILFWVQKAQNQDRYSVQAILIRDQHKYRAEESKGCEILKSANPEDNLITDTELKDRLVECLEESRRLGISIDEYLTIHLFLPIELLNEPVDAWYAEPTFNVPDLLDVPDLAEALQPETIGLRCQVILRSSERIHPIIYSRRWEAWERRWEKYQKLINQPANQYLISVHGSNGTVLEVPGLQAKLGLNTYCGLYAMQSPPNLDFNVPWLKVQFHTFAPIVTLWFRQSSINDICKTQFKEFMCYKLNKLTQEARKTRTSAQAESKDEHFGHHLAFMCENPHLIPPKVAERKRAN